jgi:hypothetical protein
MSECAIKRVVAVATKSPGGKTMSQHGSGKSLLSSDLSQRDSDESLLPSTQSLGRPAEGSRSLALALNPRRWALGDVGKAPMTSEQAPNAMTKPLTPHPLALF